MIFTESTLFQNHNFPKLSQPVFFYYFQAQWVSYQVLYFLQYDYHFWAVYFNFVADVWDLSSLKFVLPDNILTNRKLFLAQ